MDGMLSHFRRDGLTIVDLLQMRGEAKADGDDFVFLRYQACQALRAGECDTALAGG